MASLGVSIVEPSLSAGGIASRGDGVVARPLLSPAGVPAPELLAGPFMLDMGARREWPEPKPKPCA